VKAVMTHERGHTFGINHVSETSHKNMTMSPNINGPCQDSESTLGLGDVEGLRALY
jgi:predicted Zn-dependent protease